MDNSESSQSVRVAVNIRPLVTPELLVGCTDCITVYPAEKQVQIGSHAFTFDNIFGSRGSPCSSIFDECVAPLVDALFHGYNGTVLAYGQTGSGKTYTMGTNYNGEEQRAASSRKFSRKRSLICWIKERQVLQESPFKSEKESVEGLHLLGYRGRGSERAKRTGADGTRLQEGSVDSLGGNSKTVMIACVSPADTNAEETLNTLKYANRARNIQNKAIINRDPMTAQMQRMRSQIEQLQAELLYFRGDSNAPSEEIKILKHKISLLEASKMELQEALQECRISYEHLTQRAINAQVERDRLIMKIESAQNGKPWDETDTKSTKDFDIVKSYITKIQDLESELIRMRNSNRLRRDNSDDYLDSEDDGSRSRNSYIMDSDVKTVETDGVVEDVEKELEHSSLQEKLDRELKELDKKLEQKEAEMKRFAGVDTSVLKQHYEKKVQDLELEKSALQKEIEALKHNLANISSNSDDSAQKLKEEYLQKLNVLETQVAELKKKTRCPSSTPKTKTEKFNYKKIKQESEQFRLWKASREKEVLQLKKEGRRNEYEMHKLLALNQRQKLVLQRKTEEAAMATKRLKELLDSRKASRETPGGGSNKGPGIQALVQTIEHELEVTVGVHEVRSEYERQMKERAKMGEEVARLKEEALIGKQQNLSEFPQSMSPGARNSRIFALENMLATSSSTLVSMASQLSEAEERERAFSGRGRWNQVRSVAEAKNIMNFLFNLAASSRCQLRDREVDCREKDAEIRDLKEKVVNLVRQVELQKSELGRQENLVKLALERHAKEMKEACGTCVMSNSDGHAYDLRPKGSLSSSILNSGVYAFELEDMDTSDDDQREHPRLLDDEDREWLNQYVVRAAKVLHARHQDANVELQVTRMKQKEVKILLLMVQCYFKLLCLKPVNTNDGGVIRKPLSDIGNNLANASVPKPNLRKKWRKSVIQLVPATPIESQAQNVDVPEQAKSNGEIDIPLKLPRAMRSTLTSNNQLKERNSDQPNESVNNEVCTPSLGSPRQQARTKNGKENKGL
ncbi:Kinesin-like protein KIN-4C [Sesamum angolense]|uniref:Kinesin-like protein KIN-4C n=1 Tax=Sesamum angolense TaxID=2727404 RepID=A0AAE1W6K8_9LAMI|nr:Kinesin-like protein KIN-4C [Sesamum angolense]